MSLIFFGLAILLPRLLVAQPPPGAFLHSETALIGGNETWGLWRPCQSRQKELCWIDPDRSCEPEVPVDIQCQPGDEEAFFPGDCTKAPCPPVRISRNCLQNPPTAGCPCDTCKEPCKDGETCECGQCIATRDEQQRLRDPWLRWRPCRTTFFKLCAIQPDIFCFPPIRDINICRPGDEERFHRVQCFRAPCPPPVREVRNCFQNPLDVDCFCPPCRFLCARGTFCRCGRCVSDRLDALPEFPGRP